MTMTETIRQLCASMAFMWLPHYTQEDVAHFQEPVPGQLRVTKGTIEYEGNIMMSTSRSVTLLGH